MVLFQALIGLLRKSLGNVFRAIFGWATLALFGAVSEKDRNLLTAVVAAAAVWPVMLLGVLLPRTGAFLLAFVPIPKSVPTGLVRGVWIALTALVPITVGWFLRRRAASDPSKRAGLREWLMGFPVTLGLAAAFTFACVAVPIRKLMAMATGRKEAHIPLVIPPEHYERVAADLRAALDAGDLPVEPATPPVDDAGPLPDDANSRRLDPRGLPARRHPVPGGLRPRDDDLSQRRSRSRGRAHLLARARPDRRERDPHRRRCRR